MPSGHFQTDVLIIVSSDPRYDTRSSKFLKTLSDAGHKALVVGVCSDGIQDNTSGVVRVPITAKAGKSFFLQFYQKVIPYAMKTSARVVIAGDLFSLPPAIINKQRHANKSHPVHLIYDSKELYQELPSLKRKKSSFVFWNFIEKASIRYVDSAFTVNDSISGILEPKWDIPFTVVMNVPPKTDPPAAKKMGDRVLLAFSGGLQPGRGLPELVGLLTRLPDNYELKIIGDGALRGELESLALSLKLGERVHFTGRVENSKVIAELAEAHVGVYLMENAGLCHYLAVPNKFFQFISARLPVIVPKFPEMEKIVNQYDIGGAIDTADPAVAADLIMKITSDRMVYDRMRANCEKAATDLNWEVEKEKFLAAVEPLI